MIAPDLNLKGWRQLSIALVCAIFLWLPRTAWGQSPPQVAVLSATDSFRLAVNGDPQTQYRVETSTDLRRWSSLGVLDLTTGVFPPSGQFELADGSVLPWGQKFYRAVTADSTGCNSGLTPDILISDSTLTFYKGGFTNCNVRLATAPAATVTVRVARSNGSTNIVFGTGTNLTFTSANWSLPQTVTVSAGLETNMQDSVASLSVRADSLVGESVRVVAVDSGTDDEFVGPFADWIDAKRDFGAKGDGITDDTAALQSALDELRPYTNRAVLYLPAGVYRITGTLNVVRTIDSESKDIMIIGEDPATVTLRWDGAANGVMVAYGAWFAKMSRLTFDGQGKAGSAIAHGSMFSTINEFSDLIFEDMAIGIEAGTPDGLGNAETVVERCRFLRCGTAGISLQNPNSLDWFIWNSEFDECALGVANIYGAGNFHIYESLFRNSGQADISIGNTGYFSIRNNTSIGSAAFFTATPIPSCGLVTLQGNTIINPAGVPIQIGNLGPVVLLDNFIQDYQGAAANIEPSAGFVSVGNQFSVPNAIPSGFDGPAGIRLDNVVACQPIPLALPKLPGPLPHFKRPVVDLLFPTNAASIQAAINLAATMSGQRPIVHLPLGTCLIDQTLIVPAGCDVQLVGDGAKSALQWAGIGAGPVLHLSGPARATLRDFIIFASGTNLADGVLIDNCDQPGGRVLLDQANVYRTSQVGLFAQGLVSTSVALENFYHSGNPVGVRVYGGGGPPPFDGLPGQVSIFGGASSLNGLCYDVGSGGKLLVRDIWYEAAGSNSSPRFMICTNSGTFTLHGANIAPAAAELDVPVVAITNFTGRVTFLSTEFNSSNSTVSVTANGTNTSVLLLGTLNSNEPDFTQPQAQASLQQSFQTADDVNFNSLPALGPYDANFLRAMLAQTRGGRPPDLVPVPPGVTDLRIHRVQVEGGRTGITLRH